MGLTSEQRGAMWRALAQRLQAGESICTNAQFCDVLLDIYRVLTGREASAQVAGQIATMVREVNSKHPETFVKQGVENGISRAFEEGVRRQNWDAERIQTTGARVLRRFAQKDAVRDMLEDVRLRPSQISMVGPLKRVLDDGARDRPRPPAPSLSSPAASSAGSAAARQTPEPQTPTPVAAVTDGGVDAAADEAVAAGDVSAEEARERARQGERRQQELEKTELAKAPSRLDSLLQQGVVTEDEAKTLREVHEVDQRLQRGEITEDEATEIRNSLLNANVRDKLERKIRENVTESVKYLQVFESMKKIDARYYDALRFLIHHKNLVVAVDGADVNMRPAIEGLMEDVELLDDMTDLMERKDQELRMISVRLYPYSAIMSRGVERIATMPIEESFVDDLAELEVDQMSDRLASGAAAERARPAADMRCLISLVDHATKRTRFRKELRLLRIARQLEEFYQGTSDMKEARHQAESFLNRRLRRMFPAMNADEAADLKQRSSEMLEQIEQRILDERKAEVEARRSKAAAAAASSAAASGGDEDDMELSADELAKGVQIGRVEMRVAGSTRRIPTKMMPDPDDPETMVIVMRDPDTQELVPARRRGAKRVVERNRDGYWAEVR
jgi:hypothetical protein